jgi:hypothetical protein
MLGNVPACILLQAALDELLVDRQRLRDRLARSLRRIVAVLLATLMSGFRPTRTPRNGQGTRTM